MSVFWKVVRMRLPTYLYSGMPPLRACPRTIMREPNTASAPPSTMGAMMSAMISGAYWPSPCRSTTTSQPWLMAYV